MSKYLFIDGEYLRDKYTGAMADFYGTVPTVNYRDLHNQFNRPDRIYYYDSVNREKKGSETQAHAESRISELNRLHAYLNTIPSWHVREGFVTRGRKERPGQKAVDVQLAVDALEHAVAHNMTHALFITGDLDFEPLFFSLNRFGIRVVVYYARAGVSEILLEAADERQQMTLSTFHALSLPSFQENHPRPMFNEGEAARPEPVIKTGTWKGRGVKMHKAGDVPKNTVLFISVDAGPDPIQEPRLQVSYNSEDEQKVTLAFEMNYGDKITWD
jgi:uncharacterized LabA/DUF88 family protein